MARIRSNGVSSSKSTTASTEGSAATILARASSEMMGRPAPFKERTDRSVFSATTRQSPSRFACSKSARWPTCSKSKQPLVKTICCPETRHCATRFMSESREQFVFRNRDSPEFPHNDPRSHIGEPDGFVKRQTGGNGSSDCRNDGIACSGYVKNLTSQCGKALYRARFNQSDSQFAESHNQVFDSKSYAKALASLQQQFQVAIVREGRCGKFKAVRGDYVAPGIFFVVQALRINKGRYGQLMSSPHNGLAHGLTQQALAVIRKNDCGAIRDLRLDPFKKRALQLGVQFAGFFDIHAKH